MTDFFYESDILQLDGNCSINSSSSQNSSFGCLTVRDPAIFHVAANGQVEVNPNPDSNLRSLPLILA